MAEALVGILYNEPVPSGHAFSEASQDVLTQVEAVEGALAELGRGFVRVPVTRDVGRLIHVLERERVELAFNLCETVEEDPRLAWHPAAVLELLGIPFSGSSSAAIMLSTDKLTTKRLLDACGIRTPNHLLCDGEEEVPPGVLRYPVIVKPRFEDASIGIDQESIFEDERDLKKGLPRLLQRFGPVLVEEYIHGREINVSLLGYPRAEALPVAEIDFSRLPAHLYPIVGYRAKWEKESLEYLHTPRRFPRDLSPSLLGTIEDMALGCYRLLDLRDYARVDMRVNGPDVYVLEVNANPCLSPDAGFAAAAQGAGMSYTDLVARILDYVIDRTTESRRQAAHLSG